MSETDKTKKGWGECYQSRKWHYFNEARSLCGKYIKFGSSGLEDENHASPDNCKSCQKKREKIYGLGV